MEVKAFTLILLRRKGEPKHCFIRSSVAMGFVMAEVGIQADAKMRIGAALAGLRARRL